MHTDPTCPRCGDAVRPPGLWSSDWQCARHGPVDPYLVLTHLGPDAVRHVVTRATVPVWLPHALPGAWVCSGIGYAGDERTGACAAVTCMSGPSPLGGAADLVLVAEQPGIGLGARFAGLADPDPGEGFDAGPPDARVMVAGHPTVLWVVPVDADRAVFVGEAKGSWLWAVVHPAAAGVLMYDDVTLVDLCDDTGEQPDFGSPSPLLSA